MDKRQMIAGIGIGLGFGCIGGAYIGPAAAAAVAVLGWLGAAALLWRKTSVQPSQLAAQRQAPVLSTAETEDGQQLAAALKILAELRYWQTSLKSRVMRQTLGEINEHVGGILQYAKKHGESIPSLKLFFTYYLPQTEEMVKQYARLAEQSSIGAEDYQLLKKIEHTAAVAREAAISYHQQLLQDKFIDVEVQLEVFEREMRLDGIVRKQEGTWKES